MFTYAQAETILASMYGANAYAQRTTFRARLKHFKKLGIPLGMSPGKGAKILYDREHVFQWAMCLELSEFGLDPTLIVEWLKARWPKLIADVKAYDFDPAEAPVLTFAPHVMSRAWLGGSVPSLAEAPPSSSRRLITLNLPRLLEAMRAEPTPMAKAD